MDLVIFSDFCSVFGAGNDLYCSSALGAGSDCDRCDCFASDLCVESY